MDKLGYADTHFHGYAGADFSDGTLEALETIAEYAEEKGITNLLPATMTLPLERILKSIRALKEYQKRYEDSPFLGFYLEGPFIHPEKVGAQNPAYVRTPDAHFLDLVLEASEGLCKVVTIAPEVDGALDFIRQFSDAGITFSLGHTLANGEAAKRAFDAGVRRITHLYNAMPHYDEILKAAAENGEVYAELICDGVHNSRERILNAFELLGAERIILISDAMRATGMPDGEYDLGGQLVKVNGSLATIADGSKAGSVTDLPTAAKVALSFGVPEKDVYIAACVNPRKAIVV